MTSFWSVLIAQLVAYIKPAFGPFGDFFAKMLEAFFGESAKDKPDPVIVVGAAPDDVKTLIRELVIDLVTTALAKRPVLLRVALLVVKNLPDSLLDSWWDAIFAAKIAAGELPAVATFATPKTMAAAPVMMASAADLNACCTEAGIAGGLISNYPETPDSSCVQTRCTQSDPTVK